MHSLALPSLPIAGMMGLGAPELVVLLVLLMAPVMVIAVVGFALYFKYRQRREWHELVRLALEKGQPIPPHPGQRTSDAVASAIESHQARRTERRHNLTGGLVLIAVGAAVFLGVPPNPGNRGFLLFAYVPAFIGVALLISAAIDTFVGRKNKDAGPQPPQA